MIDTKMERQLAAGGDELEPNLLEDNVIINNNDIRLFA